jgi:hypothetical protein
MTLTPAAERALMNVLMYFAPSHGPSQEARALASDAMAKPLGRRARVRRIVEIIDEHGWDNARDAEVLRGLVSGPRRVARRIK